MMTLLLILLSTPVEFGIGFFFGRMLSRRARDADRLYCPMCEHAWREHGGNPDYDGQPVGWCTGTYHSTMTNKLETCRCNNVRRSITYGAAALTAAAHLRSIANSLPIDNQEHLAAALRREARDLDGRP